MPDLTDLQSIISSFMNCYNRSEAEIRSKLVVPLIEWLEYPIEYRAEEFPVYGFEGSRKLPTKHADFLLFDRKDFKDFDQFNAKHIEWVQKHSLLIVETKKPNEMPTVVGQPQFYTIWTKAVGYIITDGVSIKGFYQNPISADSVILDCEVEALYRNEAIKHFTFSELKAIKNIDWLEQVQSQLENNNITSELINPDQIKVPNGLIKYMQQALGKNALGLSSGKLLEKYLRTTDFYLQQDMRYDIPQYMFHIPRRISKALIYLDDSITPYMSGDLYHFYRNEYERLEFQNNNLSLNVLLVNDIIAGFSISFHVLDYHVSERIFNLQRVEKVYRAHKIKLETKHDGKIIEISLKEIFQDSANIDEQLQLIHYWQNCMDQIKTIETYYGIEFNLCPAKSPEESENLYENIKIIYNGISKERNIWFCEEGENYFKSLALDQPIVLPAKGILKPDSIKIHNHAFIPNLIHIMPQRKHITISVEFLLKDPNI